MAAAAAADASKALREWAMQYHVETEPLGRGSFASVSGKSREGRERTRSLEAYACTPSDDEVFQLYQHHRRLQ